MRGAAWLWGLCAALSSSPARSAPSSTDTLDKKYKTRLAGKITEDSVLWGALQSWRGLSTWSCTGWRSSPPAMMKEFLATPKKLELTCLAEVSQLITFAVCCNNSYSQAEYDALFQCQCRDSTAHSYPGPATTGHLQSSHHTTTNIAYVFMYSLVSLVSLLLLSCNIALSLHLVFISCIVSSISSSVCITVSRGTSLIYRSSPISSSSARVTSGDSAYLSRHQKYDPWKDGKITVDEWTLVLVFRIIEDVQ